jgi:hypothetical protein
MKPPTPMHEETGVHERMHEGTPFPLRRISAVNQADVLAEHLHQLQLKQRRRQWRLAELRAVFATDRFSTCINELEQRERPLADSIQELLQSPELTSSKRPTTKEHTEAQELRQFVTWGVESKLLPAFKLLQTAHKWVSTEDWAYARHEALLSKAFESYREHCELMAEIQFSTSDSHNATKSQGRRRLWWDSILDNIERKQASMTKELAWRRQVARQLALEAVTYVHGLRHGDDCERRFFYDVDVLLRHNLDVQLLHVNDACHQYADLNDRHYSIGALASMADGVEEGGGEGEGEGSDWKGPSVSIMGKSWREGEDGLLMALSKLYRGRFDLVSEHLMFVFPQHVRSAASCQERLRFLGANPGRNYRDNAELAKECERHFHRLSLMRASRSKLVPALRSTPLTVLYRTGAASHKRPTSQQAASATAAVHPSHEAAVKKATQSITRLLTPAELAMRRLQKMRQLVEGIRTQAASLKGTPVKSSAPQHDHPPAHPPPSPQATTQ